MKSCVIRVHRFLITNMDWYTSIQWPENSTRITKWVLTLLETSPDIEGPIQLPGSSKIGPIGHDCSVKWDGAEMRLWVARQPRELGPRLWVARQPPSYQTGQSPSEDPISELPESWVSKSTCGSVSGRSTVHYDDTLSNLCPEAWIPRLNVEFRGFPC